MINLDRDSHLQEFTHSAQEIEDMEYQTFEWYEFSVRWDLATSVDDINMLDWYFASIRWDLELSAYVIRMEYDPGE